MAKQQLFPPNIKSTVISWLRTTIDQVGTVAKIVDSQTRSSNTTRFQPPRPQQQQALAALGEAVYLLAQTGELRDLNQYPEVAMAIREIERVEQMVVPKHGEPDDTVSAFGRRAFSHHDTNDKIRPASRQAVGNARVWRPTTPADTSRATSPGTVAPIRPADPQTPRATSLNGTPTQTAQRTASGEIRFTTAETHPGDLESDDDLALYMHDDDV